MSSSWETRLAALSPAHRALWDSWLSRNAGGGSREELVAWVVPDPASAPTESELRLYLTQELPDYMVPTRVLFTESLPRTPSGKLARHQLQLHDAPVETRKSVPPRNDTEAQLAALFEEVLKTGPVSVDDDFFADLGGHSLIAAQLISRIRRVWGADVPLRLIFEFPTVAGLAKVLLPGS